MHPIVAETSSANPARLVQTVDEHILEIVSDSGEGAQTCGQMFADICARNGNGIWTVEIIPAEIEPPSRSRAGASGNRIRFGSSPINNAGDAADVVVALNEQVLYSRIDAGALRAGTLVSGGQAPGLTISNEDIRSAVRRSHRGLSRRAAIAWSRFPSKRSAANTPTIPARARTCGCWACSARSTPGARAGARKSSPSDSPKRATRWCRKNLDLFDDGYRWGAREPVEYGFRVPASEGPRAHGDDERQSGDGSGRHGGGN